jgi:hypothetical protein
MKVRIVNRSKNLSNDRLNVIQSFFKFAQDNSPLKKDLQVVMLDVKIGDMTTGSEISGLIKILVSDMKLIDIIQTLSHEWAHEFARQRKIKLQGSNTESQDDFENNEGGIMTRMFEKSHPEYESLFYN